MSRDITSSVLAALDDEVIYPFYAVELLFDSGALRYWTGEGTLVFNSVEWYGVSTLMSVDAIEETSEMAARGASITMSGVPTEILSLALSEPYQGRVCTIYFGIFTGGEADLDLTQIFSGYMDQMNIEERPETSTISLLVENKLVDLERARVARYTSAYQKSIYPNDKGLDFIESLQDKEIYWGRANPSSTK